MKILLLTNKKLFKNINYGGLVRTIAVIDYFQTLDILYIDWDNEINENLIIKNNKKYHIIKPTKKLSNLYKSNNIKNYNEYLKTFKKLSFYILSYIDNLNVNIIILDDILLYPLTDKKEFIYLSHNCESQLAEDLKNSCNENYIYNLEREIVKKTKGLIYVTENDLIEFKKRYNFLPKTFYLPNCTYPKKTQISNKKNIITFIGSNHPPNIVAAKNLINISDNLNEYEIKIVGECCDLLTNDKKNVELLGYLKLEKYEELMINSKYMINLITVGGGSHLKVIEALSYGIPVITTKVGSRGFKIPEEFIINDFKLLDNDFLRKLEVNYNQYSNYCIEYSKNFHWETYRKNAINFIKKNV